jgi:chromosome segregation ATPase
VSKGWAIVYAFALGISLFTSDMAFQPGVRAQTEGLDPAKISEFQSKLEIARHSQADLNQRVTCLNQRDAQLVAQRNNLEERIGALRREENKLAPEVNRLEAAYHGYMHEFEKERRDLDGFRRHLQELEARKRGQEQALQECKSKWYTINASCDLAYNLLEVAGEIKNYDGDIAAAARRERIAHDSAVLAHENLQKTKRDFDSTKVQANALDTEIHRTEHEMGATKAELSGLRQEASPYQGLIDNFANALTEAKDVNLADARRARTLRTLGDISASIDNAVVRSTAATRHADETLGPEWMKSCGVG